MNPELFSIAEIQEKVEKPEVAAEEIRGLMEKEDAVKNSLCILNTVGLEAFKSVFSKEHL